LEGLDNRLPSGRVFGRCLVCILA